MKSAASPDDVTCKPDLVYCTHAGVELCGDLYLPAGRGPFPLLVAAPGGGWRVCARASLRHWGVHLAAQGYGVFAIDYRVASTARKAFPEAVQDVIAAVRFMRGSAPSLAIDPRRIGLVGVSAGAHLAALAALAQDQRALAGGYPNDEFASVSAEVKALVVVSGIYDLLKQWQDDLALNPGADGNLVGNLIGKDPYEDPHAYFEASPIRHIAYKKNKLPVLVSWGTGDEYVNPAQSELFVRALQQARFNVRTHQAVGAPHFWFNEPLEPTSDSAQAAPRLTLFLDANL